MWSCSGGGTSLPLKTIPVMEGVETLVRPVPLKPPKAGDKGMEKRKLFSG